MHHHFDISLANKFGVNVAIFLNNVGYWIKYNQANNNHFYDGRYWTYNSVDAYTTLFPYWSPKQIRTIIEHCLSYGLIIKDNFNKVKYDQTQWYALTDLGHKLLNIPILPNGQMEITKWENGSDQKGKPIPYINTDIKPERERKKRAPLSPFSPDEQNTLLCKDLRLDMTEELSSFEARHKGEKSQYEFSRWLKSSKEYKDRNKNKQYSNENPTQETKCTVKEYGPGHPTWEANQQWKREQEAKKAAQAPEKQNSETTVKRSQINSTQGRVENKIEPRANLGGLNGSHGSEVRNHHIGGNHLRKVEDYLFSNASMG